MIVLRNNIFIVQIYRNVGGSCLPILNDRVGCNDTHYYFSAMSRDQKL